MLEEMYRLDYFSKRRFSETSSRTGRYSATSACPERRGRRMKKRGKRAGKRTNFSCGGRSRSQNRRRSAATSPSAPCSSAADASSANGRTRFTPRTISPAMRKSDSSKNSARKRALPISGNIPSIQLRAVFHVLRCHGMGKAGAARLRRVGQGSVRPAREEGCDCCGTVFRGMGRGPETLGGVLREESLDVLRRILPGGRKIERAGIAGMARRARTEFSDEFFGRFFP